MEKTPDLAIITPCYNEEESIYRSLNILSEVLEKLIHKNKIGKDSFILAVDDGSNDNSLDLLKLASSSLGVNINIIELSINSGHQKALLCGLEFCHNKIDIAITIDFDLQDDVNAIEKMIDEYQKGYEVVLGIRSKRITDTPFKRLTASLYYKVANFLGVPITPQHADFRLTSNKQIGTLKKYRDADLYLREIVPRLTKHLGYVFYERKERIQGTSKYTLLKMLQLARKSIFAKPNALLIGMLIIMIISFGLFSALSIWVLVLLFSGVGVPGWSSTLLIILFTSSMQLLIQYLIVEHLVIMGKDVKMRPAYNIESVFNNKK